MRHGAQNALVPRCGRGAEDDLHDGGLAGFDLAQCADEADEEIVARRLERHDKLAAEAELHERRFRLARLAPRALQRSAARCKRDFRQERGELTQHQALVLRVHRELRRHALAGGEQFKGDRLDAHREAAKKPRVARHIEVESRRQVRLQLDEFIAR